MRLFKVSIINKMEIDQEFDLLVLADSENQVFENDELYKDWKEKNEKIKDDFYKYYVHDGYELDDYLYEIVIDEELGFYKYERK